MNQAVALAVAIAMLAFFCAHIGIWRWKPSGQPRAFLLSFLAAVAITVSEAVLFALGWELLQLAVAVLWINIFWIVLYFFFYAGIARSVSVTLLARLRQTGRTPTTFAALSQEYLNSSRFEDRLELMMKIGLVVRSEGAYCLTSKGRRFARGACVLSRLLSDGLEG
jgi:hypothetical protein